MPRQTTSNDRWLRFIRETENDLAAVIEKHSTRLELLAEWIATINELSQTHLPTDEVQPVADRAADGLTESTTSADAGDAGGASNESDASDAALHTRLPPTIVLHIYIGPWKPPTASKPAPSTSC